MKPKNFPDRKLKRQRGALQRIMAAGNVLTASREFVALDKATTAVSRRDERTKKNRSSKAKFYQH